MIAIVDYGIGNILSLTSAFTEVFEEAPVLTGNPGLLDQAELVILPGVGAFGYAMNALKEKRLDTVIQELARNKKPLVGICLGMQLMYEYGEEYGRHQGLGLLEGYVTQMPEGLPLPHMGWNILRAPSAQQENPLLRQLPDPAYAYFVHSYYAKNIQQSTLVAGTDYGVHVPAIVQQDHVLGFQFHPEKSGNVGRRLLQNLKEGLR